MPASDPQPAPLRDDLTDGVTYIVWPEEFVLFYRFHTLHTPAGRKAALGVLLMGLLFAGAAPVLTRETNPAQATFWWSVLVLLITPVILLWAMPADQVRRQRGLPGAEDPVTTRLSAAGLTATSRAATLDFTWRQILSIRSTRELILLYFTPTHAIIVPRRAFASPLAADGFLRSALEFWTAARDEPVQDGGPAGAVDWLAYRLDAGDLRACQEHQLLREPALRRGILLMAVIGALAGVYLGGLPGLLAGGAGAFAVYFWVCPWLNRRQAGATGLLGEQRIALEPDGLRSWTSDLGEARISWEVVKNVAATRSHIFFQLHNTNAIVVPRRAFPAPEDAETFLKQAQHLHQQAAPQAQSA